MLLQDWLGATASEVIGLGRVHLPPAPLAKAVLLRAARINSAGVLAHGAIIRRVRTVALADAEHMVLPGQITDAVTISALFRDRRAGLSG
ncbi:hypothetical protein [Streptomyces sp. NPDC002215]|uniref:hypothetical protein n=1 Tax=Streptomyces sp. NPDC002215 TaxID=3154412 RepID=UPI0033332191